MVQLSPSVATPKTPKMSKSKTPKKSNAVDNPAKPKVKTPKQAKNTPAKAALEIPKMKKEALVEGEKSTPKVAAVLTPEMRKKVLNKEAKNTPKAAAQTLKNGTTSAKNKKTKTPKLESPSEDVEMVSEGEEKVPLAVPSPKKEAVIESIDSEMSSEDQEIEVKPKLGKSSALGKQDNSQKVGDKFGLFVRGFNYNSTEKAVTQHFSQFGTVTRCALPWDARKNSNRGFGFIEFASQEAVDKAAATAHTLDDRNLEVKADDAESTRKRKSFDSILPGGDHKRRKTTFDNELFVGRLGSSSSRDTIKEHFSQYGEVVKVALPLKPNSSENKGFAFVAFQEALALQRAMADNTQKIDSVKIIVKPMKKAVVREPRPKLSYPNELFVGGLHHSIEKHVLEQHFSKYGKVTNITLPWDKLVNKNKGFAFVSFESATSLESALQEDHEIDDERIVVEAAGWKSGDSAVSKKVMAVPAAAKVKEEEVENNEEEVENNEEEVENNEEEVENDEEEVENDEEEVESDEEEVENDEEEVENDEEEEESADELEAEGEDEEGEDDEDDE